MNDSNADDRPDSETFDSVDTQSAESALDKAIYAAIMEQNQTAYSDDDNFSCCGFVMLETVSANLLQPISQ